MARALCRIACLMLATTCAFAQDDTGDDFYVVDGRKIPLPASDASVALRISSGRIEEFREALAGTPGVALVPLPDIESRYGIVFLRAAEGAPDEVFRRGVAALSEHPAAESSVPVYRIEDIELVLVDEFSIGFERDVPFETGRALLEDELGARILRADERRVRFTVSFPDLPVETALRRVNELSSDPRVQYAEPAFIRVFPPRIGYLDEAPATRVPGAAALLGGPRVPSGCWSTPFDAAWAGSPNDALFPRQWALRNTAADDAEGKVGADIGALSGWAVTKGSPDVTIAVIDLGVQGDHPDLEDKLVPGIDLTGNGSTNPHPDDDHGTLIAGIAAAAADNGIGITGVDWHARIAPVRMATAGCASPGGCAWAVPQDAFSLAIEGAIDLGARVLVSSWGWQADAPIGQLEAAMREAVEENAVLVFAVGQHLPDPVPGTDMCVEDRKVFYPARLAGSADPLFEAGVVAVSATNKWDAFQVHQCENDAAPGASSWGSNRGPEVSLAAPGARILSTANDGGYKCSWGTSMAAPFVGGAASLLLAAFPDATPAEIKHWLQEGAEYFGGSPTGYDERYGHGRLDIAGALEVAAAERTSVKTTGGPGASGATAPVPATAQRPLRSYRFGVLHVMGLPTMLGLAVVVLGWRMIGTRSR